MGNEQSLDSFIYYLAQKIARVYPTNCADAEDYIQAGHLKLAEINITGYTKRDFVSYAIAAISRAMRETALESMCAVSAPYRIKKLVHKVEMLLVSGKTERDICDELQITTKTFSDLRSLIKTESWNMLFQEPIMEFEQFSFFDDILSSSLLIEEDRDFLKLQFTGNTNGTVLNRKQRWTKAKSIRPKLIRSGYGV